jgi:cyclopropane fatty-acyl-phospholipid synthase-like methyltransferase
MSDKNHWESIYKTRSPSQMSWTEDTPIISLDLIEACQLSKNERIIDVGGGESKLVDYLLDAGYTDITVLDISGHALDRTKKRLGARAANINWIVQDITEFQTDQLYDCWHDRATFHFLTLPEQISKYAGLAKLHIKENGWLILGGFSKNGPEKCSGLPITRYGPDELSAVFADGFKKMHCEMHDHETPSRTKQNFIFCSFQRF